jgi:hypothetical protein
VVESFWALPDAADIRTPLSILREQAAALTEQTKGVLVGVAEARNNEHGTNLDVTLDVNVPGLNDYRYRLLTYRQPIEMYPGHLVVVDSGWNEIENEAEFVAAVRSVLSSDRVRNILASLRAHANYA